MPEGGPGVMFYISERCAPPSYRARRFLEKRVVPALRKAGSALAAAAVVAISAFLALLERAGQGAENALSVLAVLPYRAVLRRIVWVADVRGPDRVVRFFVLAIPALAVFAGAVAAAFLLASFLLLAGRAAGKVRAVLG